MNTSATNEAPAKSPFDQRPAPTASFHSSPRPFLRRLMQLIRRTHLYVGVFLFPWAVLYGVTGFLFNHPTFLADSPTTTFCRSDLTGTALENPPDLHSQATAVLTMLNQQKQPSSPFVLASRNVLYGTENHSSQLQKPTSVHSSWSLTPRLAVGQSARPRFPWPRPIQPRLRPASQKANVNAAWV